MGEGGSRSVGSTVQSPVIDELRVHPRWRTMLSQVQLESHGLWTPTASDWSRREIQARHLVRKGKHDHVLDSTVL